MNQIYKQTAPTILLTLILVGLSAYAFLTSFSTPSEVAQSNYMIGKEEFIIKYDYSHLQKDWLHNLELAQRKWASLEIHSYKIQVIDFTFWGGQEYEFAIERDKITRHVILSCFLPGDRPGCHADTNRFPYDLFGYSVPNLFELAENLVTNDIACAGYLSFHPKYYFPERIVYNCPGIDEERFWEVTSFEVIQ